MARKQATTPVAPTAVSKAKSAQPADPGHNGLYVVTRDFSSTLNSTEENNRTVVAKGTQVLILASVFPESTSYFGYTVNGTMVDCLNSTHLSQFYKWLGPLPEDWITRYETMVEAIGGQHGERSGA